MRKNTRSGKRLMIAVALVLALVAFFVLRVTPPKETSEGIVAITETLEALEEALPIPLPRKEPTQYPYVEVTDGCGPHFEGACVRLRSGPGTEYPVVGSLRSGMVFKVAETITDGERDWYKIDLSEGLRYPERVNGAWFVASDYVRLFEDEGNKELGNDDARSEKRILVDRSDQKLYAYDGEELFMEERVSTGLDGSPTPRGTFTVFKKVPSRYMQGPLPGISDQYYDLPGVPWNLYFTAEGGAIHGAYWHEQFGNQWSHGCVNLPLEAAQKLYNWADVGTEVVVRD